jgi:hypothetical protein
MRCHPLNFLAGYVDNDYPASLIPLSSLPFDSSMIVEDTYHYSSSSKDDVERENLFPDGGGIVRLGPDHRPFEITMYHQVQNLIPTKIFWGS